MAFKHPPELKKNTQILYILKFLCSFGGKPRIENATEGSFLTQDVLHLAVKVRIKNHIYNKVPLDVYFKPTSHKISRVTNVY